MINMSKPNVNVQCPSSQSYTTLFKCNVEMNQSSSEACLAQNALKSKTQKVYYIVGNFRRYKISMAMPPDPSQFLFLRDKGAMLEPFSAGDFNFDSFGASLMALLPFSIVAG